MAEYVGRVGRKEIGDGRYRRREARRGEGKRGARRYAGKTGEERGAKGMRGKSEG